MNQCFDYLINLIVIVTQKINRLGILWAIIKILNTLYLIIKILQTQTLLCSQNTSIYAYVTKIYYYGFGYNNGDVFMYTSYAVTALLMVLVLYIVYFICYTKIRKNRQSINNNQKIVTIVPIFVLLLVQTFYTPIIFTISHQSIQVYVRGVLATTSIHVLFVSCAILIVWVTIFNRNNRVFGIYSLFIILIIKTIDEFQQGSLIAVPITISIFVIIYLYTYKQQKTLNKCILYSYLYACLYALVCTFDAQNKGMEMIYFAAGWVSLLVIVLTNEIFCRTQAHNDQYDLLTVYLKDLSKNYSSQKSTQNNLLAIQVIGRQFVQKNHNLIKQHPALQVIATHPIFQLSRNQMLDFIDAKFAIQLSKNSQDINLKKQFYLFRIKNSYKMFESFQIISQFLSTKQNQTKNSKYQLSTSKDDGSQNNSFLAYQYAKKQIQFTFQDSFLSKQVDNDKIADILKMGDLQEMFFDQSIRVFTYINAFWEKISLDILIQEDVQENLQNVIHKFQQLQNTYSEFSKGYKAEWQLNILKFLYKLVEPCTIPKFQTSYRTANSQLKYDSLLYFSVNNKKLLKISPYLLKILKCKKQQIIGQNFNQIMPQSVIRQIRKHENLENVSSKKGAFIVPIITDSHLIKTYEITTKLNLRQNIGIESFYFLTKKDEQEKTAFIYVCLLDLCIHYASSEFFQMLCLSQKYTKFMLNKKELCLSNIITSMQAKQIIIEIQKKKSLKCVFNVKNLRPKQRQSSFYMNQQTKFNINLGIASQFSDFVLLSINLANYASINTQKDFNNLKTIIGHGIQQQKMQQKNEAKNTLKNNLLGAVAGQLSLGKSFANDDENQPTKSQVLQIKIDNLNQQNNLNYCLIQNPYRFKIEQKQSQINIKSNCITFSTCIIVFSLFFLVILITSTILMMVYSYQQKNSTNDVLQGYEKAVSSSVLLLKGTLQVYEQYVVTLQNNYFTNYIQANNLNFTLADFFNNKTQQIHLTLRQFYQKFTTFYQKQLFSDIEYTLKYKYYEINTDYSSSNLLEYAYNVKLASQKIRVFYQQFQNSNMTNAQNQLDNQIMYFLMQNYNTIADMTAPFQLMNNLIKYFYSDLSVLKIVIMVIAGTSHIILLFIYYAFKLHSDVIKQLFHILSVIPKQDIAIRFNELSQGLKQYINEVPKDSLKKFWEQKHVRRGSLMKYQSKIKLQNKSRTSIFNKKQVQEQKQIISNKNNRLVYGLSQLKQLIIFSLIFSATVGAFFYKIQIDFRQDKVMLQYFKQIQLLKHEQLQNSADMFFHIISQVSINGITEPETHHILPSNKRSSVKKDLGVNFQKSFQPFFNQQNQILKQNLCKLSARTWRFSDFIVCQNVGNSILTKGYIQSSQYNDYIDQKLKTHQMLLLQTKPGQQYCNFFIHVFVRDKIIYQMERLISSLLLNYQTIQQKYKLDIVIFGAVELGIALLYLFFLFNKFIPKILMMSKIGKGYFKILPKDTTEKIQISSYIRQTNLLNKINYL